MSTTSPKSCTVTPVGMGTGDLSLVRLGLCPFLRGFDFALVGGDVWGWGCEVGSESDNKL